MSEQLLFVPLGGSGEIGMNLNLYGYEDTWVMVDCGMMISSDSGQDEILVPEIEFLRDKRLAGLVLTHAHEDHIGAITDLWLELRCPIYATPFTAAVVRRKLNESEIRERVPFKIQPPGGRFHIEDFEFEFVPITHSTVESQALMIRTPKGNVFHTGDWKLDPDPLVGKLTAVKRIKELGEEGILAVVGDSTNAQIEGHSGSESEVRQQLRKLILATRQRVVCASFSSNIARLQTFLTIAEETGRSPVLVGRSMKRMVAAAQETGYLSRKIVFVPPRDAMFLPPERVLLICTGSQGESRAALSRIAAQTHPDIYLDKGDVVFFSSKVIPGNEQEIEQLKRSLSQRGLSIVDETQELIHVSGHPCVEELKQMYHWLTPQILIPVHGYPPHLKAHAQVGHQCGIPQIIEVVNGDVVELDEEASHIIDTAPVGRRLRLPEPDFHQRGGQSRRGGQRGYYDDRYRDQSYSHQRDHRFGSKRSHEQGNSGWMGDRVSQSRQKFMNEFGNRNIEEGSSELQRDVRQNRTKKNKKNSQHAGQKGNSKGHRSWMGRN